MKITVRLPTEAYAFQEVTFENEDPTKAIKEYKDYMPKFILAYTSTKEAIKSNQSPF